MSVNNKDTNTNNHSYQIQNGVFYTPFILIKKALAFANKNLLNINSNSNFVFLDLGCGDGSFSLMFAKQFPNYKVIAVDKDENAISVLKLKAEAQNLTNLKVLCLDVLKNLNRSNYGIEDCAEIVVIGNPPWNSIFSYYAKNIKDKNYNFASSIKSRDLGIMFLNVANELKAKAIIVIHPFSYIIKASNFKSCKMFFNYEIKDGFLFSSNLFIDLKNKQEFCCGVFCYKRKEEELLNNKNAFSKDSFLTSFSNYTNFSYTTNSQTLPIFVPSKLITITKQFPNLQKYPTKNPVLTPNSKFFFTLRDLNALWRNKTWLSSYSKNAIVINEDEKNSTSSFLGYLWCDFVKQHKKELVVTFKDSLYLFANFDVFCIKNMQDKTNWLKNINHIKNFFKE